jgi:hypothetical protein
MSSPPNPHRCAYLMHLRIVGSSSFSSAVDGFRPMNATTRPFGSHVRVSSYRYFRSSDSRAVFFISHLQKIMPLLAVRYIAVRRDESADLFLVEIPCPRVVTLQSVVERVAHELGRDPPLRSEARRAMHEQREARRTCRVPAVAPEHEPSLTAAKSPDSSRAHFLASPHPARVKYLEQTFRPPLTLAFRRRLPRTKPRACP